MLKFVLAVFLVLCVFLPSEVRSASCPNIQTMQNFTAEKYVGKWYEIEKYPLIWEAGQKCITANYTLNTNGTVTVFNTGIFILINHPVSITGLATPNATDPSKLTVEFGGFGKGKYWVIDTDYDSYALVYSCSKIPLVNLRIENAWILSRTPTLDSQKIEFLKSKLSAVNSSTFFFMKTDQTHCTHDSSFDD